MVVCVALGAWAHVDPAQTAVKSSAGSSQPAQASPQPISASSPAAIGDPADPPAAGAVSPKPVPPTPIAVKKAELDEPAWDPEWSKFIEKSLPPELLSRQRERAVRSLCPRFKDLDDDDKRVFWAYFFQALASAEAGLKPTADVRHTDPEVAVEDPVTHRIARQQGLLQLGYMDSTRYGCDFDWERDKDLPEHDPEKTILQPENNLECGIRILTNQLVAQKKPLLSSTSYWVTLRPKSPSFLVFIKQMANEPAACGREKVRGYEPEPSPPAAPAEASR